MTKEEALEILKSDYAGSDGDDTYQAIGVAIEALEKQIPTKAKFFKNKAGRGWACGKCGFTVSLLVTDEDWNISYETPDYCKWCGQKIDGVLDISFETGSEK